MTKHVYLNNTCTDVTMAHGAIMEAIKNGGVFNDDFADIFALTKAPDGSAVEYVLDFS